MSQHQPDLNKITDCLLKLFITKFSILINNTIIHSVFKSKSWKSFLISLFPLQLSSVQLLSHVPLFATPWTVAHQAPLSMGFSRQEHQSGLPFPPPRDLSHPGIKLESLLSPSLAGGLFTATWETQYPLSMS